MLNPRRLSRRITIRIATEWSRVVASLASLRPWSGFAYLLAPSVFGRELHAVAAGRRRHQHASADEGRAFRMRRHTHMLEKGLSMRPRREAFAADYIEALVDDYQCLLTTAGEATARDLSWTHDVLVAFFAAASGTPAIERARSQFVAGTVQRHPRAGEGPKAPYHRPVLDAPSVSFDAFRSLAEHRRSVRWFAPRPIERQRVLDAIEVALLSPSACNRQPFEFRIFSTPEDVARIAALPLGTRGWAHNIPVFIVVVGDLSAFADERDRHVIYTDGGLVSMSLVFALETQGLSSCCVNWPDIPERERAMARELNLAPHQRPVMCLAVGYPDPEGLVPFSDKRPLHEVATFMRARSNDR